MNNKKLGTEFEHKVVKMLSDAGFWVRFMTPDNRGAQPFDIIAVKDGVAIVADCKTSKDHIFRISRLEENQKLAFEKWKACGNMEPLIIIEYNDEVKFVKYSYLKNAGKVDLNEI